MARVDIYKGCELIVNSKVKVIGKDRDGFEYTDNTLFLQLEEPCGRRWDHVIEFDTCVQTDKGFHSVKESAEKIVESLRYRVLSRGYIDDTHWIETAPKYGSEAYQRQWMG